MTQQEAFNKARRQKPMAGTPIRTSSSARPAGTPMPPSSTPSKAQLARVEGGSGSAWHVKGLDRQWTSALARQVSHRRSIARHRLRDGHAFGVIRKPDGETWHQVLSTTLRPTKDECKEPRVRRVAAPGVVFLMATQPRRPAPVGTAKRFPLTPRGGARCRVRQYRRWHLSSAAWPHARMFLFIYLPSSPVGHDGVDGVQ